MSLPATGRSNEPFEDSYVDIAITRDKVRLRIPLSEIVQRIAAIAKTAILKNAGRMAVRDGEVACIAIPISESRMATLGGFGA